MIKVTIKEENVYVKGHAGYAPSGQDIVCAFVSGAIYYMCTLLSYDAVKIMEKGNVHLIVNRGDVRNALRNFIKELQEQYPNHIKLEEM